MLYLVHPTGRLFWNELPSSLTLDVAAEHDVDLGRLDWQPSERAESVDLIRLALRHGVRCSTGIVLPGHVVSDMLRPAELIQLAREGQASSARSRAALPEAVMEQMFPGWREQGEHLDERLAESVAESIREAEEALAQLLSAPVDPSLRQHWSNLHGFTLDPE